MSKQSIKKIFDNLSEITSNMKFKDMGETELLARLRQETYIKFCAEKARKEFGNKGAKKFKTAKEALDYLHNL